MLQGKLELWDIRDVEQFVNTIIQRARLDLNHHDREDLAAFLIETTWELSLRYQPGGITFSTWAGNTLRLRIVDHTRNREGRTKWTFSTHTYQRERPQVVSLDTELASTIATPHRDNPTNRTPDLARLLRTRGSDEAWNNHSHPKTMQGRTA